MKLFNKLLVLAGLVGGLSLAAVSAPPVGAVEVFDGCQANQSSAVCQSRDDEAADLVEIAVNTLLLLIGMVAVIMIVVGGIRYIASAGDSARVKAAKDTILYSVVGLVVAILAYAIVNFVIGTF